MARLALHICCGPCSITVLRALAQSGLEVLGVFYNPNIHPLTEYLRRREGAASVAARLGIDVVVLDEEYDPAVFLRQAAFRETGRCRACYALRLWRTAAFARERGIELFSTTLLYSKYQDHQAVRAAGEEAAGDGPAGFYYRDFRDGWQEGIELSREWGIYRQPYCGCIYSEYERYRKRLGRANPAGRQ